ncbi:GntR family transcriptional regulator [Tessaracoccus lubricantis]|uniref:GntR family transcriptional regulator n=1 Tax=Tessaracoccus lubricantis TaxID=545543 RepID=A0ABP9FJF8_9ACTN
MTTTGDENLGLTQRSLAERARDVIRERITTGTYQPGYRIKERELSEELGISRIPVREALAGLKTEGFITLQPRRGAVVTELVPEDLREIFELREALEVQEVELALRHGSPEERAKLLRVVEKEQSALKSGNGDLVRRYNAEFHEVLIQMTHNSLLATLLEPLRNRLNWLFKQNDDPSIICGEHSEIAQAIASGDAEGARALAEAHVATSRRLAHRLLFNDGGEA